MPQNAKTLSPDLIRYHQALKLNAASHGSAALVMLIIVNGAFLMGLTGQWPTALVWVAVATSLVVATRLYARFRLPGGITVETAQSYILGHMALTAITGLTWSLFAIVATDIKSELSVIIASTFLISISLGGLLPGSAHRLDYLIMLSCALLPFPLWIIVQADSPIRFFGVGYLVLYAVFFLASRKVHAQTIESIRAHINEAQYSAQSIIVASIGHDLAQPLLAQRHYIEILSRSDKDGSNREILDRLAEAQSSQEYLLTSLMQYERTNQGVAQLNMQEIALDELITNIALEFAAVGSRKSIITTMKLDNVTAHTDAEIVKNCVRNLLSNAYKYTQPAGAITLTLKRRDGLAEFTCSDTGIGIAPSEQARAFEPFVRLETDDQTPGLGLGLTSVKSYAELLGGSVELISDLGEGVTIILSLPIKPSVK